MRRRAIAVVASVLLAGIGSFVLLNFVRGAEERATAGEELKPVWIVTQTVPMETPGENIGIFVQQELVPTKSVPAAAIGEDLKVLEGFVAQVDLVPGEVLLSTRFVSPEDVDVRRGDAPARNAGPEEIQTLLQVPIRLDVEQALGGIIQPGDTVAVLVSIDSDLGQTEAAVDLGSEGVVAIPDEFGVDGDSGGGTDAYTGIIIQRAYVAEVQVEAVPSFSSAEDENSDVVLAPTTGYLITFALPPEDVERLVHAATYGTIWLAAQGDDAYDYPTEPVNSSDIFTRPAPLTGNEILIEVGN